MCSLALPYTLAAAFLTRKLRKNIYLAALMPTIFNGLIVGPIVYFEFIHAPGTPAKRPKVRALPKLMPATTTG